MQVLQNCLTLWKVSDNLRVFSEVMDKVPAGKTVQPDPLSAKTYLCGTDLPQTSPLQTILTYSSAS